MKPARTGADTGAAAASIAEGDLEPYRKKRDFKRTPEPAPAEASEPREGFSFVVQKHAARRLHYDFRLELNGVLKSWAVTKGPSFDPADKRLAVHVEDHPLEYGSFEGVIPKGQYGGGTVMIWDRGRWEPEGDPEKGYAKGKLSFRLFGERLKGRWTLARMGGRAAREEGYKNWLMIKSKDEWARPGEGDVLVEDDDVRSAASQRTMAEIAEAADRVWTSEGEVSPARLSTQTAAAAEPAWPFDPASLGAAAPELPEFVPPELATLADKPPAGEDWVHEIKFDGYRTQCRIENGRAIIRTRNGLDWTDRFRHIADRAAQLPVSNAILDGEIVALEPSGVSSFALLQETLKSGPTDRLVYYAFDLLFWQGRDLRAIALQQRKNMLEALIGGSQGPILYSDHQIGSGPPFFENACRMALEGVVSKRLSSPYRSGRTRDWLKSKCIERQEFVIGGFTRPTTKVHGIGALLLGYYEDGKLVYVGRVGTGFSEQTSRELREQLDSIRAERTAFAALPAEAKRDAIWVEPRLVCEVEYRSWTHDGRLRHASFQGLREDRPAETVTLERSRDDGGGDDADAKQERSTDRRAAILENARLTHPDRVLYPQQGLTKRGLAEYYIEVADWMLPHVAGRPLSLVRCPSGQGKECFYQKHITKGLPQGLREVMIKESEGEEPYSVVDGVEGLLALVQMNVLEIHPWGSPADDVERPDRLIFDLDPDPSVGWPEVVEAAFEMRERLSAMKLASFVKSTGGKGLHVVVPIIPRQEWPEAKAFCEAVATAAARDSPDRYTTNMAKAARPGKIFLDYLRNGRGATAIAAYSPRARPGAPVATPLAWEELSPSLGSGHYTVATLPRRLNALARDPWADMGKIRQSIAGKQPKVAKRAR